MSEQVVNLREIKKYLDQYYSDHEDIPAERVEDYSSCTLRLLIIEKQHSVNHTDVIKQFEKVVADHAAAINAGGTHD